MFTAFFQLSNVWNINVQNIFSTNYEVVVDTDTLDEIIMPSKILIRQDDVFKLAYNTKENYNTNKTVNNLLLTVNQKGVYEECITTRKELVESSDVIYSYVEVISHNLLDKVYNIKGTVFEKNNVEFDNIYVNTKDGEVYFYNAQTDECYMFVVDNLKISTAYTFNDNIAFAFYQDDEDYLTPVVIEDSYLNLTETNPYSENDEVLLTTVEAKVNYFFRVPSEKWAIFSDDSYVFSGEDITIKYYNNNILDYRNNYESKKKINVVESFAIAKTFIDSDTLVTNDLILKDISKSENSFKFCFNVVINNTEVVFDNEFLDYYIEIEVENGIVKHYKKYVMNYDIDYNGVKTIEKDVEVFAMEENFDSIQLVYLQNMDTLSAGLCWAMTFGEETVYAVAE